MPKLNWKLLTKKRSSSTQGLPPGKEDLAWVTNTVTLICGERDAVLVDTFLSVQHSKELLDWVAESGKMRSTTIPTLISQNAMNRPEVSGSARWIRSKPCIREQW